MKLGKASHGFKIVAVAYLLHLQTAIVLYNCYIIAPGGSKRPILSTVNIYTLASDPDPWLCCIFLLPALFFTDSIVVHLFSPPRMHIPFSLHTIIVHISKLSHQLAILFSDIPSAEFAPRIGSSTTG
jgi:hypothetical protein